MGRYLIAIYIHGTVGGKFTYGITGIQPRLQIFPCGLLRLLSADPGIQCLGQKGVYMQIPVALRLFLTLEKKCSQGAFLVQKDLGSW